MLPTILPQLPGTGGLREVERRGLACCVNSTLGEGSLRSPSRFC